MSNAPVSVRFDVTGSDRVASETRKISKELDALRTAQGGVVSSVKQMEAGFRTDALGGFSTAVTNADTKVTGFRAKLTQIGSTFAQNATSFGVATASIWGIYNAYDSLEKVQIRAHAAAQRVSTLETTIATLTERRRQAVEKGNLSAEQMAIIDDRITNAHGKLAVAQERNADLQQDVNEAWAGFASQIGPQVVAAGASVVQMVTSLRGSFATSGGVINAMRNTFGGLVGSFGVARVQGVAVNSTFAQMPIFANTATVAVRGLSTAMKGLLIGTGIGAIVVVLGLVAEHFMRTADAAKAATESVGGDLGTGEQAVADYNQKFETEFTDINELLSQHAASVKKAMNDVTQIITKSRLDQMREIIAGQRFYVQSLEDNIKRAQDHIKQLQAEGSTQRAGGGVGARDARAAQIKQAQDDIKAFQKSIDDTNKSIDANEAKLNSAIGILKEYGTENNRNVEILRGVANAIGVTNLELVSGGTIANQFFDRFDTRKFLKAGGDINVVKSQLAAFVEILKSPAINADPHVIEAFEKLVMLKVDEWAKKGNKELSASVDILKTMDGVLGDVQNKEAEWNALKAEQAQKFDNINTAFGVYVNNLNLTDVQLDRLNGTAEIQNNLVLQQEQEIGNLAAKYGLLNPQMATWINSSEDNIAQMNEMIAQNLDYMAGLTDAKTNIDLVSQGHADAAVNVRTFVDGLVSGQAEIDATNTMLMSVATTLGVDLPEGITLTNDNLKALITEFQNTGSTAETTNALMEEALGAAREGFEALVDAAAEGGDAWKDAWKEFPKQFIPKGEKGEVQEFIDDMGELVNAVDVAATQIAVFQQMLALGLIDEKEMGKWTNEIAEGLRKIRSELEDIVGQDIANNLVNPFIQLREDGLTQEDVDMIAAFESYFKQLSEGGITDTEVALLQQYAKDLRTAAADAERLQSFRETGIFDTGMDVEDIMGLQKGEKPEGPMVIGADVTEFDKAVAHVDTEVARIDALRPIVDFMGDHRQFVKTGNEVLKAVAKVDALRPIVEFLGDHRQFVKTGNEVLKAVAKIDALRPIVDFMGDHSSSGNFMDVASDVEDKIDDIDGTVVNVEFHAFRTGNWSKSAQHGMHEVLMDDTVILAHKGERVDIGPSPSPLSVPHGNISPSGGGGGGGATILHVEMPVYIGGQMLTKIIKDIPLSDTGMFPSA